MQRHKSIAVWVGVSLTLIGALSLSLAASLTPRPVTRHPRAGHQPSAPTATHHQNTNPAPATAQPALQPVAFKNLPANAEFYFTYDNNRYFPQMKVSETTMRSVPTAASLVATTAAISPDTLVIPKDAADAKAKSSAK